MNQELLQTAITFFKEQHGTYESMKTQMLAGGISQSDIDKLYEEIKKLGLDPTAPKVIEPLQPPITLTPVQPVVGAPVAPVTIHPVSDGAYVPTAATAPAEAMNPTSIAPQQEVVASPLTPQVGSTSLVTPPTTSAPTALSTPLVAPLAPPTAPTQTVVQPVVAPAPKSNGKGPIFSMVLFIILTVSLGGVFVYATYSPESELAVIMSQTLEDLGLLPTKNIPVQVAPKVIPKIVPATTTQILPATTTESSAVSVSATVLATSSTSTSTQEVPAKAITADVKKLSQEELLFANNLETCTKYKANSVHLLTSKNIGIEILGIVNGKCLYIERLQDNGKMECRFAESIRPLVAKYYKEINTAKSISYATKDGIIMYTIDGKTNTNPLDEAMNNGMCIVSGYKI